MTNCIYIYFFYDEYLTSEAVALIKEIKSIADNVDYEKLCFAGGNKKF